MHLFLFFKGGYYSRESIIGVGTVFIMCEAKLCTSITNVIKPRFIRIEGPPFVLEYILKLENNESELIMSNQSFFLFFFLSIVALNLHIEEPSFAFQT